MKKEELFDIIGEVDEQKIAAAGMSMNVQKKSRSGWLKWGFMAACFAVALFSAILYFPHSNRLAHAPEQNENIDWNNPPINDGEIWGQMHSNGFSDSGENRQPDLSIKPNLEGFQYAKNPDSYEAPKNGTHIMTDSLKAAVEKYGNQVTYRIHLAIYRDQNKLDNNSTEAQKWFNELKPEDFTVTYLDYYDGSAHSYNFYMDACSYEDLIAFCNIESEYGFVLSLYCESIGDLSSQAQTAPQIFNTPDTAE